MDKRENKVGMKAVISMQQSGGDEAAILEEGKIPLDLETQVCENQCTQAKR